MSTITSAASAVTAPNQHVEVHGRRLAYRSIGTGTPVVLCTRFRGNMDVWDPLFLDSLAAAGCRVITFDYSGLGLSTGERSYDPVALARDAHDLIEALDLRDVAIGGWSLGGLAAQVVLHDVPRANQSRRADRHGAARAQRQDGGAAVLRYARPSRRPCSRRRSFCSSSRVRARAAPRRDGQSIELRPG